LLDAAVAAVGGLDDDASKYLPELFHRSAEGRGMVRQLPEL